MRLAIPAALLFAASGAGAQSLSGRVFDQASREPLGGVVVSAFDSSGSDALSRTVTDRINGYRLALPPGAATIRFRRIGYAPVIAQVGDAMNGRIDVTMSRLPTQLPPIKALAVATCDRRPDHDQALALWQEVRSGMLASIVARESRMGSISVLAYEHDFDGDRELPRAVQRIEFTGASRAFSAGGHPDTLARRGYLEYDRGTVTPLGPDDAVLFDESFLSTHCFHLVDAKAGDDSTLGLGFRPAKGRGLPDVEGTVWLRKDPLDLSSVEFRYVNLPPRLRRGRPGGSIEFRPMPNGITTIHQWHIRSWADDSRSTVNGAVLELMQWPEAPPYFATLGAVSGVAREKETGRLMRGREVRLGGTPFQATTDSTGAFRIMDVLPGVYAMDVGDPILELHALSPRAPRGFRVEPGENDVGTIEIETGAQLVKRACSGQLLTQVTLPPGLGSAAVIGMIVDSAGRPVHVPFSVEVRADTAAAGSPALVIQANSDFMGRFRICGVPLDGRVTITTEEVGGMAGRAEVVFEPSKALVTPYRTVAIALQRKPPGPPPELLLKPHRY
ncbi:MAG TPA: carboxypeptidase-like regulatory domain-containing protein [Gemmatimonadaceae bacterium]|nr:carboxypeptidase-like regulatory domain-containing protein [Gemmatimonadaceae bacterium]